MDDGPTPAPSCCGPPERCVFAKALLSRSVVCECSARRAEGEQTHVICTSPIARTNCATLAALLHERARFALRLPATAQPLLHAQALRLQCGGLAALQQLLGDGEHDVHRSVAQAQQRYGSLTELPWQQLVAALAAWQAPRRARGR
jgi:hypothetical protein